MSFSRASHLVCWLTKGFALRSGPSRDEKVLDVKRFSSEPAASWQREAELPPAGQKVLTVLAGSQQSQDVPAKLQGRGRAKQMGVRCGRCGKHEMRFLYPLPICKTGLQVSIVHKCLLQHSGPPPLRDK